MLSKSHKDPEPKTEILKSRLAHLIRSIFLRQIRGTITKTAQFACGLRKAKPKLVDPANMYFFKVNNKNIRKRCEICSKLTKKKNKKKTPERHQRHRSGVFLLTLNMFHIFYQCFYC